jgi:hypothetical protein
MEPMQFPAQAQQEAGNLGAASFNMSSTSEFIPKGKMVATKEQFPDLGDMDDNAPKKMKSGKGKKKKGVVSAQPAAVEEDEIDDTV